MFGLFGGFKTIKEIAVEIGVNHRVFGTALTEKQVNYAFIKAQKSVMVKAYGEHDTYRYLAISLIPTALDGLTMLQQKFGNQDQILLAKEVLVNYFNNNQDVLDKFENEKHYSEN